MELTRITPDPKALQALSHPVRLRILGLLRVEGPTTATALAQRLGLNSGATSYHLRQLSQHGFIEDDADRGNGRDRWWRAKHQSTRSDQRAEETPEGREAIDAWHQAIAVVHTERLQRAVEEAPTRPVAWRRASTLSDWGLRLTPERAHEVLERIFALLEETEEEPEDNEDAGAFVVHLHAFPRPGTLAPEGVHDAADDPGAPGPEAAS